MEHIPKDYSLFIVSQEKALLLLLAEYEIILKKALDEYNPSVIARYCFDLAHAFNDFYNNQSILSAESDRLAAVRLDLAVAVKIVLTDALGILSIDTLDEM